MSKFTRLLLPVGLAFSIGFLCFCSAQAEQEELFFRICSEITDKEQPYILQGVDNWLFGRNELASDVAIDADLLERIAELKAAFDYVGIEVIFANLPHRPMLHYDKFDLGELSLKQYDVDAATRSYNQSVQDLEQLGFITPNVLEYLQQKGIEDYGFKRDSHWTPNGALSISKLVKEVLDASTIAEQLSYADYEIQLKEQVQRRSDLGGFVTNACGVEYPSEPQKVYEVIQNNAVEKLFSDSDTSNIVLWGTSYSLSSNFAEFLQAELDVEVNNYGFNLAGLWRSLRHYFLEDSESIKHPQVAIWEFPYGYIQEFNLANIYKEIIPTIYGTCEDELVVTPYASLKIPKPNNLLGEFANQFPEVDWLAMRSTVLANEANGQSGIKLSFTGQEDPWMFRQIETNSSLTNTLYEFSVWLWTDANQPNDAALYMYNGSDIAMQKIILTSEPTKYTIKHKFKETENTAFSIRIDGIENQVSKFSEENKDSYLYASKPSLHKHKLEPFLLMHNENTEVQSHDFYTYIHFDNWSILDYDLHYTYSDGKVLEQSIKRDRYSKNNGKYFYELPEREGNAHLLSITLDGLSSKHHGSVGTQLCRKPSD